MAKIGVFKSMDHAIRYSLLEEPETWCSGDFGRFLFHDDGLRLVKPVITNRWTITEPLGYVKLSWWTNRIINSILQGEKVKRRTSMHC